jgi:hypothetical protein
MKCAAGQVRRSIDVSSLRVSCNTFMVKNSIWGQAQGILAAQHRRLITSSIPQPFPVKKKYLDQRKAFHLQ